MFFHGLVLKTMVAKEEVGDQEWRNVMVRKMVPKRTVLLVKGPVMKVTARFPCF